MEFVASYYSTNNASVEAKCSDFTNVTYDVRVESPDGYNFCPVPDSGVDAIFYGAIGVVAACLLSGKRSSAIFALLLGGALQALSLSFNLYNFSNGASWWLSLKPAEIYFYVFLPPLLLDSALKLDMYVFKQVISAVLILAFVVVLLTSIIMAPIMLYGLGLAKHHQWHISHALLFVSMLGSTDAVAVSSLLSACGCDEYYSVLLEGESLFNDATSIVLFRVFSDLVRKYAQSCQKEGPGLNDGGEEESTAVVVVVELLAQIGYSSCVSVVMGVAFGLLTIQLIKYCRWRELGHEVPTVLTFGLSYVVFFMADCVFEVSGVIAVVAFGIVGALTLSFDILAKLGLEDRFKSFWSSIVTLFNALIFYFAGAQAVNFIARSADVLLSNPSNQNDTSDWVPSYSAVRTMLTMLVQLPIIYGCIFCIRYVLLLLFRPLINLNRRKKLTRNGVTFVSFCGLRGALSLIMVQAALTEDFGAHTDLHPIHVIKAQYATWVSGVVLLTLLVNAPMVGRVMTWTGVHVTSMMKLEMRRRAKMKLLRSVSQAVHQLMDDNDDMLSGADWNRVKQACDLSKLLGTFLSHEQEEVVKQTPVTTSASDPLIGVQSSLGGLSQRGSVTAPHVGVSDTVAPWVRAHIRMDSLSAVSRNNRGGGGGWGQRVGWGRGLRQQKGGALTQALLQGDDKECDVEEVALEAGGGEQESGSVRGVVVGAKVTGKSSTRGSDARSGLGSDTSRARSAKPKSKAPLLQSYQPPDLAVLHGPRVTEATSSTHAVPYGPRISGVPGVTQHQVSGHRPVPNELHVQTQQQRADSRTHGSNGSGQEASTSSLSTSSHTKRHTPSANTIQTPPIERQPTPISPFQAVQPPSPRLDTLPPDSPNIRVSSGTYPSQDPPPPLNTSQTLLQAATTLAPPPQPPYSADSWSPSPNPGPPLKNQYPLNPTGTPPYCPCTTNRNSGLPPRGACQTWVRERGGGGVADVSIEDMQRFDALVMSEYRSRLVMGLKKFYNMKRREGLLGRIGLQILTEACNRAIEHPSRPLNIWSEINTILRYNFPLASFEQTTSLGLTLQNFALNQLNYHTGIAASLSRCLLHLVRLFNRPIRASMARQKLVELEIAVQYWASLTYSEQATWIRKRGWAGVLVSECQQQSIAAWQCISRRELENKDLFVSMQTHRATVAVLRRLLNKVEAMEETAMIDEIEEQLLSAPIQTLLTHYDIHGPQFRHNNIRQTILQLPVLQTIPRHAQHQALLTMLPYTQLTRCNPKDFIYARSSTQTPSYQHSIPHPTTVHPKRGAPRYAHPPPPPLIPTPPPRYTDYCRLYIVLNGLVAAEYVPERCKGGLGEVQVSLSGGDQGQEWLFMGVGSMFGLLEFLGLASVPCVGDVYACKGVVSVGPTIISVEPGFVYAVLAGCEAGTWQYRFVLSLYRFAGLQVLDMCSLQVRGLLCAHIRPALYAKRWLQITHGAHGQQTAHGVNSAQGTHKVSPTKPPVHDAHHVSPNKPQDAQPLSTNPDAPAQSSATANSDAPGSGHVQQGGHAGSARGNASRLKGLEDVVRQVHAQVLSAAGDDVGGGAGDEVVQTCWQGEQHVINARAEAAADLGIQSIAKSLRNGGMITLPPRHVILQSTHIVLARGTLYESRTPLSPPLSENDDLANMLYASNGQELMAPAVWDSKNSKHIHDAAQTTYTAPCVIPLVHALPQIPHEAHAKVNRYNTLYTNDDAAILIYGLNDVCTDDQEVLMGGSQGGVSEQDGEGDGQEADDYDEVSIDESDDTSIGWQ